MSINPAGDYNPKKLAHAVAGIQGAIWHHSALSAPAVREAHPAGNRAAHSGKEHEGARNAGSPFSTAGRVSSCTVELVSDYETLLRLKPAWDRLAEESDVSHPFLTFEWIQTWWECFGAGKGLHILLVKNNGKLKAIAPLMRSTEKKYGVSVRQLGLIYNPHAPRCDFLVARDAKGVYPAVWRHLWSHRSEWDVLALCQLPSDSRTLLKFRRYASAGRFPWGIWKGEKSPYLLIGTPNGYPDGTCRKEEKNLKNRFNRLQKLGQPDLEVITQADATLNDGLRLEAAAWKAGSGTAIVSDPAVCAFYSKLAERAALRGWLRLYFLSVRNRRIAFTYSLSYKQRLFLLKPGYDPDCAQYAPSRLLLSLTLRNALAQGITEYDLLGSDDEWKLKWTNEVRPHSWLFIYPRTPRGFLLHGLKFGLLRRICKMPSAFF